MHNRDDLTRLLNRIDGRGYKAYKDITGVYAFDSFTLHIDHVQGDPFAAPSKVRARVPQETVKFPEALYEPGVRRMALSDYLSRILDRAIRTTVRGRRGSGKSGTIRVDAGGQEVLERTAVIITPEWVEARLHVGLPAAGRTILGREAEAMLCREIPEIVSKSLFFQNLSSAEAERFVENIENQAYIRSELGKRGLVAFVADGAVLPRESGASDSPLPYRDAVAFRSPDSLRVVLDLPNPIHAPGGRQENVSGMGFPHGVTLVVGGGYHGKSTLLRALERGVYPHIPGDGREYVVTCQDAVKIRAEDGRRVEKVNISPFITDLPYGRSTQTFSSEDASGSTSQAANIVEAVEAGAKLLLLDEDTSATNFMVRDARMQTLVEKAHEPITPFLDRVRELYERLGVSTVLVMGGSGDYFDAADTVIMMREFLPLEVTEEARKIAREHDTRRRVETTAPLSPSPPRAPDPNSFDASRGRREVKIDVSSRDVFRFGNETVDLRFVEQIVDWSQTRAIACAIHLAAKRFMNNRRSLREVVDALESFFDKNGLDPLDPFYQPEQHPGDFARPRKYEIAAAINRMRSLRMKTAGGNK